MVKHSQNISFMDEFWSKKEISCHIPVSGRRLVIDDDKAHESVHQFLRRISADKTEPDPALGHQNNLKFVFCRGLV